MYILARLICSNSSQSILTRPWRWTLLTSVMDRQCLSLSGTEIVKDRPDTLSIHGPRVPVKLHTGCQMP